MEIHFELKNHYEQLNQLEGEEENIDRIETDQVDQIKYIRAEAENRQVNHAHPSAPYSEQSQLEILL